MKNSRSTKPVRYKSMNMFFPCSHFTSAVTGIACYFFSGQIDEENGIKYRKILRCRSSLVIPFSDCLFARAICRTNKIKFVFVFVENIWQYRKEKLNRMMAHNKCLSVLGERYFISLSIPSFILIVGIIRSDCNMFDGWRYDAV